MRSIVVMCHAAHTYIALKGAGVYFGEGKQHALVTFRIKWVWMMA